MLKIWAVNSFPHKTCLHSCGCDVDKFLNELNLNMIKSLKNRYNCLVGYSGHEQDLEPSVAAVVMGACVIERHITLSHEMWGTDQAASLTVPAMGMLKGRIMGIHEMIGNGDKILSEAEAAVRRKLRG